MDDLQLKLLHYNEQNRACARQWWLEATEEHKKLVLLRIQADMKFAMELGDDAGRLVAGFAHLAFSEMSEKMDLDKREGME